MPSWQAFWAAQFHARAQVWSWSSGSVDRIDAPVDASWSAFTVSGSSSAKPRQIHEGMTPPWPLAPGSVPCEMARAQKGKAPVVVRTTGAPFEVNLISAVDARGALRFMVNESAFNAEAFIEFLRRLIVDEHPAHTAKNVKQFVAEHADLLELCYVPCCPPELNPDERAGNHIKHHTAGEMTINGPQQLKMAMPSALRRLVRMPHIVRAIFEDPGVAVCRVLTYGNVSMSKMRKARTGPLAFCCFGANCVQ